MRDRAKKLLELTDEDGATYGQAALAIEELNVLLRSIFPGSTWSDEYVASTVLRKDEDFKSEAEFRQFCKVGLTVATAQLDKLKSDFKAPHLVDEFVSREHRTLIHDYVFDIKPYAEYLTIKNNGDGFSLFGGGKNYRIESFQFAKLAKSLFYNGIAGPELKAVRATSVFALRQSLESKFQRCIGVALWDKHGNSPRLKHGFHVDFILDRDQYFSLPSNMKSILIAYGWTNGIVHGGYQPLAWQVVYALDVCSSLFSGGAHKNDRGANIHGAIQIHRLDEMRQSFLEHFRVSYDHGQWCVEFETPDAGTHDS